MTGTHKFILWLALGVWLSGSGVSIQAQEAPPIILVIDSSEEVNSQDRHRDLYAAVEKVVFFIAAYNPVSIVSTCPDTTSMPSPTQDAAVLRAALSQIAWCSRYDQALALQKAVAQLGDQTGDIIYLVNGQFLHTDLAESLRASATALTPLQDTRSCLYVIPIGNIFSTSGGAGLIDRDAVQDLVNAAGCGQRYEGQKTPTVASTLLEAVLLSQGRRLMTRHAEQLPLFSRATARLNQPFRVTDEMQAIRIDIVWGSGALDVALQPPADSSVEPTMVSGAGYQSLTITDPAPGPWNIKLSVTQVPENQVAIVLFSQSSRVAAPIQSTSAAVEESPAAPAIPSAVAILPTEPLAVSELPISSPSAEATAALVMPISDTFAAPTTTTMDASSTPVTTVTEITSDTPAATSGNPLPLIAGVVIVGVLSIVLLFWRKAAQSKVANPTLHSRPTADLPPPNLNAHLAMADKRRAAQMHAPVPIAAGFGEEQFRQFPAVVVFRGGPQNGQSFEVDSSYFVIGRHSASSLRIQDGTVSREHARIIFDNAQNLYLIENVSQAGTQVNGQFITQRRPLYSGDLIQVGNIQIHFQLRVRPQI